MSCQDDFSGIDEKFMRSYIKGDKDLTDHKGFSLTIDGIRQDTLAKLAVSESVSKMRQNTKRIGQ